MNAYPRNGLVVTTALNILCWTSAAAAEPADKPIAERTVTVVLYNDAEVSGPELARAKAETARIFHETGVAIDWLDHPPKGANIPQTFTKAWRQTSDSLRLLLRILPCPVAGRIGVDSHTAGLALEDPKGERFAETAYVFYRRAQDLAAGRSDCGDVTLEKNLPARNYFPAVILGHVMAHEIGHLLLGPNSHSSSGIMSTPWLRPALARAACGELRFTSKQAKRIRAQVENRTQAAQR